MQNNFLEQWQSPDRKESIQEFFVKYFSYLVDSVNYEKVLPLIAEKITEIDIQDDVVVLKFGIHEELAIHPRSSKETLSPKSPYYHLIEKHEFLYLENAMIKLGDHGLFFDSWADDIDEGSKLYKASNGEFDDIESPMTDYSDLWVYHPTEKNENGKPKLYLLDHETGDIDEESELNIGALFLHRLAEFLELEFEDLVLVPQSEEVTGAWWQSLNEPLKKWFGEEHECDGAPASITKLWKANILSVDSEIIVEDFKFLLPFKKLFRLSCTPSRDCNFELLSEIGELVDLDFSHSELNDLSFLSALPQVSYLNVSSTNIESLEGMEPCVNLRKLNISNTQVTDLSPITKMTKIKDLRMSYTLVSDISLLEGFDRLWYLYIDGLTLNDYSVIKKLPSLNWLNMDETNFSDFRDLIGIQNLGVIYCMKVPASFESCLVFIKSLRDNLIPGFSMDCDFDSPFRLLPALQNAEFDTKEYSEELYMFLYSALKWYHKPEYIEVVDQILELFCEFELEKTDSFKRGYINDAIEFYLKESGNTDEERKNRYLNIA